MKWCLMERYVSQFVFPNRSTLALVTCWDATNRSNQRTRQESVSLVKKNKNKIKPVVVPISLFLMVSRDKGGEAAVQKVSVYSISPC